MTPLLWRRTHTKKAADTGNDVGNGISNDVGNDTGDGGKNGVSGKSGGATASRVRRVTLVSKPGCHLCDDARAVVERVCAQTGAEFEEKDITGDEALRDAYWEQIPVVLVDGEQHTFWRVDESRLRRELAS